MEYKIVFESLRYAKGKKIEHLRYVNREPNSKINTYEQGTKLKVIISDQKNLVFVPPARPPKARLGRPPTRGPKGLLFLVP